MTADEVSDLLDATWPAERFSDSGGFRLRAGGAGGRRVSAATALGPADPAAIAAAEAAMRAAGARPIFMLRDGEDALDAALAARGYAVEAPVLLLAGAAGAVAGDPLPPMQTFPHWPPLRIAERLWSAMGTDKARLAVMARARGPKTALLGRSEDRPAGVAFVALAPSRPGQAMLHALAVRPELRRRGLGRTLLRAGAQFARSAGAETLCLAVEAANSASRGMCEASGLSVVARYHYRVAAG